LGRLGAALPRDGRQRKPRLGFLLGGEYPFPFRYTALVENRIFQNKSPVVSEPLSDFW
jgi:hypothetical protein